MLSRMPLWLKVLAVFAALVGGLPSPASAHTGHDHGVQSPVRLAVGAAPVLDPVEATMDAQCAVSSPGKGLGSPRHGACANGARCRPKQD